MKTPTLFILAVVITIASVAASLSSALQSTPTTSPTTGKKIPPATLSISNRFFEILMGLPLPALKRLVYGLSVPSSTGGCSTGLDGGALVKGVSWPPNVNSVSFGAGNSVAASTNGLEISGGMHVRVQHCSFACLSCIFDDNKNGTAAHKEHLHRQQQQQQQKSKNGGGNNNQTELGCSWLDCCCGLCQANFVYQLAGIGLDFKWSFGQSGGRVSASVSEAQFSSDWGKIAIQDLSCNALWGLIKINFGNIWHKNIGSITKSFQPQLQTAVNAVLGAVDQVVCDASTSAAQQQLVVSTYSNGTGTPCTKAPAITSFPLAVQDINFMTDLWQGSLPITLGTKCHTTPTCLEVQNLPSPYSGASITASNCQFCTGFVTGGVWLGLSARITASGLPQDAVSDILLKNSSNILSNQQQQQQQKPPSMATQHEPVQFRSRGGPLHKLQQQQSMRRSTTKKHVVPRRTTVAGASSSLPSNCTTSFSDAAFATALAPVAPAILKDLASFAHPARSGEQFKDFSACSISFAEFGFPSWKNAPADATVPVVTTAAAASGDKKSVNILVSFPKIPSAKLTANVPVSDLTCVVPTMMMQALTQKATGTITVTATAAAAPAFQLVATIDPSTKKLSISDASVAAGLFDVTGSIVTSVTESDGSQNSSAFVFQSFAEMYADSLAQTVKQEINTYIGNVLDSVVQTAVAEQLSRFEGVCEVGAIKGSSSSSNMVVKSGAACGASATVFPAPVASLTAGSVAFQIAAGPVPASPPFNAEASQQFIEDCSSLLPSAGSLAPAVALKKCNASAAVLGGNVFLTVTSEIVPSS